MEFLNELVAVDSLLAEDGKINVSQITWQEKTYPIITVGRQWKTEAGRHVLVEAAGGTRFELQLDRERLVWLIKRIWRPQAMV
jgi:hypothetical protein